MQKDDSNDGFSTAKDSVALVSEVDGRLVRPLNANLCSSSSADRVGKGGQTVVTAATEGGE